MHMLPGKILRQYHISVLTEGFLLLCVQTFLIPPNTPIDRPKGGCLYYSTCCNPAPRQLLLGLLRIRLRQHALPPQDWPRACSPHLPTPRTGCP